MRRPLANALDIDLRGGLTDAVTPHAGSALLIELVRRSGIIGAAEKHVLVKRSTKGLRSAELVESFVVLSALGGDCLDDFDGLRRDRGLAALLGYDLPAASTARQWLDRFHDPQTLADRPQQGSFIPPESDGLAGLKAVVQHSARTYVAAVQPDPSVTLDVDAHLVESSKASALPTYKGFRGYQPLLVQWAETGLVLADEFRDGNVPAGQKIRALVDEAVASLPARAVDDPWQIAVRSDSAAYETANLDHWQQQGWRFAVSANMSPQLKRAVEALAPADWTFWTEEQRGVIREWAEVAYVPSRPNGKADDPIYRYVAIRVRTPQGVLFGDGSTVKHFAVVTNAWDTDGETLLTWQRGKCGTIELVNDVLKNELAAGVYPSDKFGANAAWLRLQVLTHNVLELLKATALDPEYRKARPKRLRFAIFTQFGRVVHHARMQFVRLTTQAIEALVRPGLERLRAPAWAVP
ncbi:MAG: IS1380 family transposase [Chloroflexota bacterium]